MDVSVKCSLDFSSTLIKEMFCKYRDAVEDPLQGCREMQSKLIGIGIVKICNANSCLRKLCITIPQERYVINSDKSVNPTL